jgi:hypothetical protein
VACRGDKHFVVRDETPLAEYDAMDGAPAFGPDGTRLSYVARKGDRLVAVVDEAPSPAYEDIVTPGPLFGKDGRHVAYVAKDQGKYFAVIDGEPGPTYDQILGAFTGFDDDGAIEYLARRADEMALYRVRHVPAAQ